MYTYFKCVHTVTDGAHEKFRAPGPGGNIVLDKLLILDLQYTDCILGDSPSAVKVHDWIDLQDRDS